VLQKNRFRTEEKHCRDTKKNPLERGRSGSEKGL
jgi:hypothetical protein